MTPEEFRFASRSLDDLLKNPSALSSAAEFADALEEIPAGQYLCGCPWSGGIIPHFCPTHLQPVVFEIREPRQ